MTNQQILTKAITKVIAGGWYTTVGALDWDEKEMVWSGHGVVVQLNSLIFNHDFAKALWGNERVGIKAPGVRLDVGTNWQYQLQCMVIADDPIKYLGANI